MKDFSQGVTLNLYGFNSNAVLGQVKLDESEASSTETVIAIQLEGSSMEELVSVGIYNGNCEKIAGLSHDLTTSSVLTSSSTVPLSISEFADGNLVVALNVGTGTDPFLACSASISP